MKSDLLLLQQLLKKDSLTEEELQWISTYCEANGTVGLDEILRQTYEEDLIRKKGIDPAISGRMRRKLMDTIGLLESPERAEGFAKRPLRLLLLRITTAAAVLLFLATGGVFYFTRSSNIAGKPGVKRRQNVAAAAIVPGGNRAVLHLADGSVVVLDSAGDGQLAMQGRASVIKKGALVSYADGTSKDGIPVIAYNLLTTPKGGQYQLVLQDGTHVWLNAASSIKFPSAFSGKERLVEVTGEVYFEVTSMKDRPFRIKIDGRMEAEVLGTSLNVMAYKEEPSITTTLVDGSVRLVSNSSRVLLKPGQEGRLARAGAGDVGGKSRTGGQPSLFQVADADIERNLAWKNGMFQFENTGIETIMRQVSRWYDVDIEYRLSSRDQVYSGTMPRTGNIDSLLKMLQYTGTIHFAIDGRKVVVTK